MIVVISLGYFLLGFIIVFCGGLWWLEKWDMFDFYIDDEDDYKY
tara:strand:- start:12053 stop:12184 length:132 start_codon:yes stop_codon:yes gene_type:complete